MCERHRVPTSNWGGGRRWYIVVTIQGVEVAITEIPKEAELFVAGDFNVDFLRDGRMETV